MAEAVRPAVDFRIGAIGVVPTEGPVIAGVRATILPFVPGPPEPAASTLDDAVVVVLDTAWTAPSEGGLPERQVALRDVVESVLARRDLTAETSALLEAWAERSGVVEATIVDGTSSW